MCSVMGVTPTHTRDEGMVKGTLGFIGGKELLGDGKEGETNAFVESLTSAKVGLEDRINGGSSQ